MLQKYRKCKIKYLLKPPFTPVYDPPPLHLVYAPPPPPAPPSGNVLPLTNALTHSLDSIRKIYLQKILQKLRKCKNQVPIKVPFYPHICPPTLVPLPPK